MTSRDTLIVTVKAALITKVAAVNAAATVAQETINAVGVNTGANPQRGATASQINTTNSANAAYAAALQNAEMVKQMAITQAKATLRATGDLGPV